MKNQTPGQLFFYKSGLKALGTEALDGRPDAEIRRAGRLRVRNRVIGTVLAAGGVVGMGAETVHAINHSPTMVYQDHLLKEQQSVQNGHAPNIDPAHIVPSQLRQGQASQGDYNK